MAVFFSKATYCTRRPRRPCSGPLTHPHDPTKHLFINNMEYGVWSTEYSYGQVLSDYLFRVPDTKARYQTRRTCTRTLLVCIYSCPGICARQCPCGLLGLRKMRAGQMTRLGKMPLQLFPFSASPAPSLGCVWTTGYGLAMLVELITLTRPHAS
jgi:hypothetical protein